MSEEVYALVIRRDTTLGEKVIYLFKTKELAEKMKEHYESLTLFEPIHTVIGTLEVYDSFVEAKGSLI
jgi:hypothetical protein